jgi:hypothetical protein
MPLYTHTHTILFNAYYEVKFKKTPDTLSEHIIIAGTRIKSRFFLFLIVWSTKDLNITIYLKKSFGRTFIKTHYEVKNKIFNFFNYTTWKNRYVQGTKASSTTAHKLIVQSTKLIS